MTLSKSRKRTGNVQGREKRLLKLMIPRGWRAKEKLAHRRLKYALHTEQSYKGLDKTKGAI